MGHTVEVYDLFGYVQTLEPFYRAFARQKNFNDKQLIGILDYQAATGIPFEILQFEPDLVLRTVGRLFPELLKAVRKLGVKSACWFLDDPQEIDATSKAGVLYDNVFTVEPNCVAAHQEAGSKGVAFLPLGCFPPIQKKMEVEDRYKSDICFIGVAFPARVEFFDSVADFLKDYNVKIIGGGLNIGSSDDPWLWKRKLKRLDVLEKFIIDDVVNPEEAAKYYNGAKINLNYHRSAVDQRFSEGNKAGIMPTGVSGRTFEIAGCGAFQMIDDSRPDYARHFIPDKEIAAFHDTKDFKRKVEYYLSHEEERQAIAEAAQKRAYAEHTYEKRLQKMLEQTGAIICGLESGRWKKKVEYED
jgi:spore maturation protein CgeB